MGLGVRCPQRVRMSGQSLILVCPLLLLLPGAFSQSIDLIGHLLGGFEALEAEVLSSMTANYSSAPYTVVSSHSEGVEQRDYPTVSWVCTQRITRLEERSGMFWTLFRYLEGSNVDSAKIAMTTPVTTLVQQDASSVGVTQEMCFFLGGRSQPPLPTEEGVYLKKEEPRRIVTRRVSGYMDPNRWHLETEELRSILTDMGIPFLPDRHYEVGYDAPYKFWNRRNEVWFLVA